MLRRSLFRAIALVAIVPLACSSSPSSSPPGPSSAKTVSVAPTLVGAQVKAAKAAYESQLDVLKVASKDFTIDLTKARPPIETSGPQTEALARAVRAQAAWLSAASNLSGAGGGGGGLGGLSTRVHTTEHTGTVSSAIIGIDDALIIAGLALAAWGASKGVQKAVEIRTDPASQKIQNASSADLKVINSSLGLPETTTKEDAKKAFDDLSMSRRLSQAKEIEQRLRLEETNNTPGVNGIPAEAIQRSVAESSVECGKTALKATVSASTFAGQGYSQAAQALGASERAAGVIDFTISAVSEVTDTPLQPLDLLAKRLEGTAASKETSSVVVPAAPPAMTKEAATKVLASDEATLRDFAAAIDVKIRAVIDSMASVIGAVTNGDGTLSVNAPSQVHQILIDDAKNVQVVQLRDLGPAKMLIATDCHGSQVFDVDTSKASKVDFSIAQNTCTKGDCSAILQLVDPLVTLPAECERCINSTCGQQCTACDPNCVQTVESCYDRCSNASNACVQSCYGCEGEGCYYTCSSPCYRTENTCDDACDALPESQATDRIGECIQGPCGQACASVIK